MTQPRKEQIKDVQAKFSALDPRLTSISAPPTPAQPLGLVQSTTFTPPGVSFNPLQTFLGSTVTGVFGGVIDTSPGYIVAQIQGPYISAAGDQVSIIVPGLNAGIPIFVTILASDIVSLGGSPVLTTSRLAARINATLAPYLATAGIVGVLVATNVNGYLWVRTPTTGATASITVREVTSGKLNVYFGAGSGSSLNAIGYAAPKRGIATVSPDGQGARAYVRLANGEPALTRQTQRVHMGDGLYVPDNAIGQEIYAKVTGSPGKSATIAFYTTGKLRPSATTGTLLDVSGALAVSNFASLNATDTLTISVGEPNLPPSATMNVNFAPPPVTVQDVIDKINAAWGAASGSAVSGNQAAAVSAKAAYSFPDGCTFVLKLNAAAPVTVTLSSAVRSQAQLLTAINAAIGSAGQASQGQCLANQTAKSLFFIVSNLVGPAASVTLSPGVPPNSYTPPDMRALNELGIAPGTYGSGPIAQLYGADEVTISNPSRSLGSTLSISGSAATLGKMGLPGPISVGVGRGEETAVPGAEVRILIPEAMDFGEVPDNQDSVVESFLTPNRTSSIDPTKGVLNAGLAAVIGPDGTIPSDVVSKIFESFAIDSLSLGSRLISNATDQIRARLLIPWVSPNFTLLASMPDLGGTGFVSRFYLSPAGDFVRTTNALWNGSAWTRDAPFRSTATRLHSTGVLHQEYEFADGSTWPDNAWRNTAALGSNSITGTTGTASGGNGTSNGFSSFGYGYADLPLIPRVDFGGLDPATDVILLYQAAPPGANAALRTYHAPGDGRWTTSNARWNGSNWVKDVNGTSASLEISGTYVRATYHRASANDAPWTSWDETTTMDVYGGGVGSGSVHGFAGAMTVGNALPQTAVGRTTPRLRITHDVNTSNTRTLISCWTGGSGINFYLYRGTGFNGGTGDVLIQSCNAYWNESDGLWHKENSGDNSHLNIWSGSGGPNYYFKGGNIPFAWPDSTWHLAFTPTRVGIQVPYSEDPYNTLGTAHLLQTGNIVKAWGAATFARDSGGIYSQLIHDSYNVSGWSVSGNGNVISAGLYAPFSSNDYVVLASQFLDFGSGRVPTATQFTVGCANSGGNIIFEGFTNGGTLISLNSNSTQISVQFMAIGRQ